MSIGSEVSLTPREGWHCTHIYYRFDRARLASFSPEQIATGRREFIAALGQAHPLAPARVQISTVAGHKADFGLMLLDPDPLKVDALHQRLMATTFGPVLVPTYSYVSLTEVSEYVPTVAQYGERLVAEGETAGSEKYQAKMRAYEAREEKMRIQRLTPDMPPWPNTCFYPMNKKRKVGENWFALPFGDRNRMMAEHGRSGMTFAGKVTQLITTSFGFDDWEWGVTLWATHPEYLKEIVYKMRFDEASARYAEFGPFYVSYVTTAEKLLGHCQIG